jgi:hypothetical protein
MKVIAYTRPDGGVTVMRAAPGARLARAITVDGQRIESAEPVPVDAFMRGWPVDGAVADWAETEDEFIERMRAAHVPAEATDVTVIDESAVPADRTQRDRWRIKDGAIVIASV